MKFVHKYKSGYSLKLGPLGYYRLYKGRALVAWRMSTRSEVREMIKYLES